MNGSGNLVLAYELRQTTLFLQPNAPVIFTVQSREDGTVTEYKVDQVEITYTYMSGWTPDVLVNAYQEDPRTGMAREEEFRSYDMDRFEEEFRNYLHELVRKYDPRGEEYK